MFNRICREYSPDEHIYLRDLESFLGYPPGHYLMQLRVKRLMEHIKTTPEQFQGWRFTELGKRIAKEEFGDPDQE